MSRWWQYQQSTGPEQLKGAAGDLFVARVATPIWAAIIYGIYEFFVLGTSTENYFYTYVPVLGGVAATFGLLTYHRNVTSRSGKRSWKNLVVFLGFLPYLFSLYMMVFLGLYPIYKGAIVSFSIWSILAGIFWIVIGYRSLYTFYLMTEMVRQYDETHPIVN